MNKKRIIILIGKIIGVILLSLVLLLAGIYLYLNSKNLKELPKPMGNYTVGITHLEFTDLDRKEIFDKTKDSYREIPVTIFYPADSDEGKSSASYSTPEALKMMSKLTSGLWNKNMSKLKTHVYEDVKISNNKDNYPVIIFNHGYASYEMQNTVLCSDLASYGYIVISIGHPYESTAVKYTDGRIIEIPKSRIEKFMGKGAFSKEYNSFLMKLLRQSKKEVCTDVEAMEVAEYLFQENNEFLTNNLHIWVQDTIFIANQLENLNNGTINSIFKGKLNLSLGLGITGHSYGGATATQTCLSDDRFVAGINIDGGDYGDYLYKDIKTPFMILGSEIIDWASRSAYIYNSQDAYRVIVSGTEHWGFTDVVFSSKQAHIGSKIGKREMYEFREIVTKYNLMFFEKYLLKNDSVDLRDIKYKDIRFYEKKSKELDM